VGNHNDQDQRSGLPVKHTSTGHNEQQVGQINPQAFVLETAKNSSGYFLGLATRRGGV
jgi:hypothetical protein